jgi:putative methanogenesis marker protein 7
MILIPATYKGGIYQHEQIVELIEDLGGYIVQKHVVAAEVVLQVLIPKDDVALIRSVAKPLAGALTLAPLVGTEVAVVSPSLEIHHLPHTSCDIAEYLREFGAKTNMIGLARGFGKRIANLNVEERDVINEHDCAVYVLGNFEACIAKKLPVLRRGIHVPIILTGAPATEALKRIVDPPVEGYVGGVGRVMHRFKRPEELKKLDEVVEEVSRVLEIRREEIAKDPLSVLPPRLMDVINEQVPAIQEVTSPTPITVQMAGLRVKLPFENHARIIEEIEIEEGVKVKDIADVTPSRIRNYILIKIKPFSETNVMV